jgi:hypothetical protein
MASSSEKIVTGLMVEKADRVRCKLRFEDERSIRSIMVILQDYWERDKWAEVFT